MSDAIEQGYEVILNHLMRELDRSDDQLSQLTRETHLMRGLLVSLRSALSFQELTRLQRQQWDAEISAMLDNRNDTNAA